MPERFQVLLGGKNCNSSNSEEPPQILCGYPVKNAAERIDMIQIMPNVCIKVSSNLSEEKSEVVRVIRELLITKNF